MKHRWLGRVEYSAALRLQESLVQSRREGSIEDTLLFLEHEPVYTIGRTPDRSSLPLDPQKLPHPLVEINRGGKATYHGPGQLVVYPIVDLRQYGQDLHAYLRALENGLLALCADLEIPAHRREGLTGIWVGNRKLASIGVGVRRWITMHGLALNVNRALAGFSAITPCGIDGVTMTSLEDEGSSETFTVETVARRLLPFLESALQALSPESRPANLPDTDRPR